MARAKSTKTPHIASADLPKHRATFRRAAALKGAATIHDQHRMLDALIYRSRLASVQVAASARGHR